MNMYIDSNSMEKTEARSMMFSEMESYWTLPLRENAIVTDVAVTKGKKTTWLMLNPSNAEATFVQSTRRKDF